MSSLWASTVLAARLAHAGATLCTRPTGLEFADGLWLAGGGMLQDCRVTALVLEAGRASMQTLLRSILEWAILRSLRTRLAFLSAEHRLLLRLWLLWLKLLRATSTTTSIVLIAASLPRNVVRERRQLSRRP